ncbi:MAG: lactonase family protein [Lachnospiraceae bacterium]|nr:lactonase family protein [Lachnospiraceae bacterium]
MSGKVFMYVSNWDEFGGSPGIGLYQFDQQTGALTFSKMIDESISFGVTCINYSNNTIYFANETEHNPACRAGGGGRVYAFRVNPETGDLAALGYIDTLCPNPCYLELDETGSYLLVANHSAQSFATTVEKDIHGKYYAKVIPSDSAVELISLHTDGSFGEILDVKKHTGDGPSKKQLCAHPHSITRSPSGKLFGVVDKGNDTACFYKIKNGKLELCQKPLQLPTGSGPRYMLYHPREPYFYVNHEICRFVRSYAYTENGDITAVSECSILPDNIPCSPRGVDMQGFCISKDGRYLYTLVHRPPMISILKLEDKGEMTLLQALAMEREWPRAAAVSPNGRYLVTAALKNGEIDVFRIEENGTLTSTEVCGTQPAPTALTFFVSQ